MTEPSRDPARARKVLRQALQTDAPLEECLSYANEVWATPELVVRIDSLYGHRRLRNEIEVAGRLPPEVCAPEIVAYGCSGGADWIVSRRVHGTELARAWRTMTPDERRHATAQLAEILRALHRVPAPQPAPPPQIDAICERLRKGEVPKAIPVVESCAASVDAQPATTLIHDDVHFENVLWDGKEIVALLDFEKARAAPPDTELEWLSHVCAFPARHASEDHEHLVEPDGCLPVIGWLREDYPELFAHPRLLDRLIVARLDELSGDLLEDPPHTPPRADEFFRPSEEIARVVDGTSDLHRFFG